MSKVKCNQCEALAINGTPSHEIGCPLSDRKWVIEDGFCTPSDTPTPPECSECGCECEGPDGRGDYTCSCMDPVEDEDFE